VARDTIQPFKNDAIAGNATMAEFCFLNQASSGSYQQRRPRLMNEVHPLWLGSHHDAKAL
jgi:hypothetical protein